MWNTTFLATDEVNIMQVSVLRRTSNKNGDLEYHLLEELPTETAIWNTAFLAMDEVNVIQVSILSRTSNKNGYWLD